MKINEDKFQLADTCCLINLSNYKPSTIATTSWMHGSCTYWSPASWLRCWRENPSAGNAQMATQWSVQWSARCPGEVPSDHRPSPKLTASCGCAVSPNLPYCHHFPGIPPCVRESPPTPASSDSHRLKRTFSCAFWIPSSDIFSRCWLQPSLGWQLFHPNYNWTQSTMTWVGLSKTSTSPSPGAFLKCCHRHLHSLSAADCPRWNWPDCVLPRSAEWTLPSTIVFPSYS